MKNKKLKNEGLKKVIIFTLFFLLCIPSLFAQNKISVKGTVMDKNKEPMIGVTIKEVGTSGGTITDFDGNFNLTVTRGAELQISYVGYKTTTVKVNTDKVVVTLFENEKLLDEVVVVGYGVQKKSSLTGAVSQVKSEDMTNRTITRPEQALQGKTSGVEVFSSSARPGASPSIRIRGISSNGSSDPLYVVDGRLASDIGGIDPNDIESMEVLKDASSAAIYGAQAGNGVVLITTKKGKGDGKITYEFQYASQSLNKVPKVLNSEQFIDYFTEAGLMDINNVYKYWDGKTNTDWLMWLSRIRP